MYESEEAMERKVLLDRIGAALFRVLIHLPTTNLLKLLLLLLLLLLLSLFAKNRLHNAVYKITKDVCHNV